MSPSPKRQATQAEFWSRAPRRLGRDLVAWSAELPCFLVCATLWNNLIHYSFGHRCTANGSACRQRTVIP
jgi:hypothetical protein